MSYMDKSVNARLKYERLLARAEKTSRLDAEGLNDLVKEFWACEDKQSFHNTLAGWQATIEIMEDPELYDKLLQIQGEIETTVDLELTEHQVAMLRYAIDLAFDTMLHASGFTEDDWDAIKAIKEKLGNAPQEPGTSAG